MQGDLRKASTKVVPRLGAEMEAGDIFPAAGEALEALETALQDIKAAQTNGDPAEEVQEAVDRAGALLLDAQTIKDKAKTIQDRLAWTRYRNMPDHTHREVQDVSTRFNVAAKTISRLQTPSSTAAPAPGPSRVVVDEGVRGLKVRQYISAPFSGEGPQARRDFALWRAEWMRSPLWTSCP